MKIKIILLLVFIGKLTSMLNAQNTTFSGCYSYSNSNYYEELCLSENGSFIYKVNREFLKLNIEGNWQIRDNDKLILDSRPQKDKIIVREYKQKNNKIVLKVRSKDDKLINYNLCLISSESDTVFYKDQWDKTIIKNNFSSFYLIDAKGFYSPTYKVAGVSTNYFEIFFETDRVFENEAWELTLEGLKPNGLNGKPQEYILEKTLK